MRGSTLDEFHQSMDSKLRITADQQMDVIGHDLHLHKFLLPLLDAFLYEYLETGINWRYKDFASILGTEHHMVVAIENNICAASNYCIHTRIIAENSSLYKG